MLIKAAVPMIAVALLTAGCATGVKYESMKGSTPTVKESDGRIYFYRNASMFGAAIQPAISLNGAEVGSSKPGGFFYVDRPIGDYKASAATEVERSLSFTLGAREIKYIKTSPSFGVLVGRINFELVDPAVAESELVGLSYTGQEQATAQK